MAEARRAFICGHPVGHSRSPVIHAFWLAEYGIEGSYRAIDMSVTDFPGFLGSLTERGLVGGNVTIPHKEAAHALVRNRDAEADLIGAVNTLWFEDGELRASNSDAYGFSANLDDHAPGWRGRGPAVVLGAGGGARAIVHALKSSGIADIRIVNRTRERALELADRFGGGVSAHDFRLSNEILGDARLLVNTTSLGMEGHGGDLPDISPLPPGALVTDIVYAPLETPLLAQARRLGLHTVDGLGMLLHQAVPGFEKWFGRRPEVSPALRRAVEADLGVAA